jgi:hypothetical protein
MRHGRAKRPAAKSVDAFPSQDEGGYSPETAVVYPGSAPLPRGDGRVGLRPFAPEPGHSLRTTLIGIDCLEPSKRVSDRDHAVAVTARDSVTGMADMAYVATRSADWLRRVRRLRRETRVCSTGERTNLP